MSIWISSSEGKTLICCASSHGRKQYALLGVLWKKVKKVHPMSSVSSWLLSWLDGKCPLYQWSPRVWRLRPCLSISSSFALYRYLWIFRILMVLGYVRIVKSCTVRTCMLTTWALRSFTFHSQSFLRTGNQQSTKWSYEHWSPLLCLIESVLIGLVNGNVLPSRV